MSVGNLPGLPCFTGKKRMERDEEGLYSQSRAKYLQSRAKYSQSRAKYSESTNYCTITTISLYQYNITIIYNIIQIDKKAMYSESTNC